MQLNLSCIVNSDLYKCSLTTTTTNTNIKIEKVIPPSPRPPPRCSHQAVFYRDAIYILGGELASADQYHHYKDFWKFDLKTQKWTELCNHNTKIKSQLVSMSPRSGHRSLVWRNYLLTFGGFFESTKDTTTRWYNDLHVYNFATEQWLEVAYSKLATIPPPRSACAFAIDTANDLAFVYGGFSKLKHSGGANTAVQHTASSVGSNSFQKLKSAEAKIHTDCWTLHLKNLPNYFELMTTPGVLNASLKPPAWDRIRKKGDAPTPRSGASSGVVHKGRMLLFGGVRDEEGELHSMESVFFDDLFALDLGRKSWFSFSVSKNGTAGRGKKKGRRRAKAKRATEESSDEEEEEKEESKEDDDDSTTESEDESSATANPGWDLTKLRSSMFAFLDENGNIVYENIGRKASSKKKERAADSSMSSQRSTPLPRINAVLLLKGNSLILYGGLLEVGDREVTCDDMWIIDLTKRDIAWQCVLEGNMHRQVWKGTAESDADSYVSSAQENEHDFDEDDEDDEDDSVDIAPVKEEEEQLHSSDKADDVEAEALCISAKKKRKKEMKRLIEKLEIEYKLEDRSPKLGESLTDFYKRTVEYWNCEVAGVNKKSGEIAEDEKKTTAALMLAQDHFEDWKAVVDRLDELESQRKEESTDVGGKQSKKSKEKKDKKKKKKKDSDK